jgi:hypothetical protein
MAGTYTKDIVRLTRILVNISAKELVPGSSMHGMERPSYNTIINELKNCKMRRV